MRFTLADLKKTVSRRKGEVHLVPFLLRPGDLRPQLEQLIALFEGHVGRERVYFPEDRPAELIGDYRLARCLTICLSEWYEWRSPAWPEGATGAESAALHAASIESSSTLRLALYDFVNEVAGGYLAGPERDPLLDTFAVSLGLARSTLDDLLRLDADPQQVLERLTDTPPTAMQLATRYNQRAVETVLANAATVEWEIAPRRSGAEPLGTLVKRACFLARQTGVQYEVTFAQDPTLPSPTQGGAMGAGPTGGARPVSPAASPAAGSPDGLAVETAAEGSATKSASADSDQTGHRTVGARPVSPAASPAVQPATVFAPDWPAATKPACADSDQTARDTVGARPVSPAVPRDESSPHGPFPSSLPSPHGGGAGEEAGRGLGLVAEHRALYAVASPPSPVTSLDATEHTLLLTLYGPQELTGAPTQYGERLARLCRALLGYRRDATRPGRAALAGDGLRGTARVFLHGRPVAFALDDRLLRLLDPGPYMPGPPPRVGEGRVGYVAGETGLAPTMSRSAGFESAQADFVADHHSGANSFAGPSPFDSSLESRLAEEWASLERERVTAGWDLEREPEPLLAGETILVPDFALRRGDRRIFLEIAGYWRPEYRERKLRKLTAVCETLGNHVSLIVAAPETARPELGALVGRLPVLWYRDYLSAPALLALLEREYNDFEARRAALDAPSFQATVMTHGIIAPDEAYALLHCYTRAELASMMDLLAERLEPDTPRWVDGLGLCAPAWHEALLAALRDYVAQVSDARLPLAELGLHIAKLYPKLAALSEGTLEMLARQAGLRVVRSSLFAALVLLDTSVDEDAKTTMPVPLGDTPVPQGGKTRSSSSQPRSKAKRKHSEREISSGYATADLFSSEP